jgi:hypothetical protein
MTAHRAGVLSLPLLRGTVLDDVGSAVPRKGRPYRDHRGGGAPKGREDCEPRVTSLALQTVGAQPPARHRADANPHRASGVEAVAARRGLRPCIFGPRPSAFGVI